jgi:hypothetical protein
LEGGCWVRWEGEACALLDDELVPHLVEVAALAEEVDLDGVAALIVTIANLVDHHHNTASDDHQEEDDDDDEDKEAKKRRKRRRRQRSEEDEGGVRGGAGGRHRRSG